MSAANQTRRASVDGLEPALAAHMLLVFGWGAALLAAAALGFAAAVGVDAGCAVGAAFADAVGGTTRSARALPRSTNVARRAAWRDVGVRMIERMVTRAPVAHVGMT